MSFGKILTGNVILAMVMVGLCGCVSTRQHSGVILPEKPASQLQVGKSTQQDVLRVLGTPSSISPIDLQTWYYVSRFSKTCAFLTPTVLEHRAYVLTFSPSGTLLTMEEKTEKDLQMVPMVKRVTPSVGQSTPVMKQLFRNLGKAPPKPGRP